MTTRKSRPAARNGCDLPILSRLNGDLAAHLVAIVASAGRENEDSVEVRSDRLAKARERIRRAGW
jgi:hypothetical protein